MPTYTKNAAKCAQGVAYVDATAASAGCVLHRIPQENDLGIDGFLELIRHGSPLNRQIALQIKTGGSYWKDDGTCRFSVGKHRSYWENHPLPVYAAVVSDTLKSAAWINLKKYLKAYPQAKEVKFTRNEVNTFNEKSFRNLFIPLLLGETPRLNLRAAMRLFNSDEPSEVGLGLDVLFRRFPNKRSVWKAFGRFLTLRPPDEIPPQFVYYLAHIPWHGDIFGWGEMPNEQTRRFALGIFESFGRTEILKLLSLVDENGICRGAIGQSVEAVVSVIPASKELLKDLACDKSVAADLRETAATILAIHHPNEAKHLLLHLAQEGSEFCKSLLQCINEVGAFNPYA